MGRDGQTRTKQLASVAEAKIACDKLIAQKLSKGYEKAPQKRGAKPSKAAPVRAAKKPKPGRRRSSIDETCAAIEAYFERLPDDDFELTAEVLRPQSIKAVNAIETKLDLRLSADVRAFLCRGLRAAEGSVSEGRRFGSIGFDWLDAKQIIKHTQMLRNVANNCSDDDDHAKVIRSGLALTFSEPELVVVGETVYHFSFRNTLLKVARSFSGFLDCWLASGCFSSHSFDLLYEHAKPYLPSGRLPPSKNTWVKAYKQQFPNM